MDLTKQFEKLDAKSKEFADLLESIESTNDKKKDAMERNIR